jgi:hypothetical protein
MPAADTNLFGVTIPQAHDINSMIDGAMNATVSTLQFPEDRPKYYCTLLFSAYSFGAGTQTRPVPTGGTFITLPMPVVLLDNHKVAYDEKPMAKVLLQVLFGGAATGAIGTAQQTVGAWAGLAPNWYQTVMFDRPVYKRHELQFKLAPRNYNESRSIQQIITTINNAMAPGISALGGSTSALFSFPNILNVVLRPNSEFLYKFKPAVVEQFTINYNGGGQQKAFYHSPGGSGGPMGSSAGNNPPESVEFTVQILEIEYWLTGQFNNNPQQG